MILVGGREFIPFKCAGAYLGGYSATWLKDYFEGVYGGPKRVYIGPRRSGWFRDDLDRWLRKQARRRA